MWVGSTSAATRRSFSAYALSPPRISVASATAESMSRASWWSMALLGITARLYGFAMFSGDIEGHTVSLPVFGSRAMYETRKSAAPFSVG